MEAQAGSVNLKPNKPDAYEGQRDYLVLNTWLYKVEQYLVLMQLANPSVALNDSSRILYASTFLSSTAAVWWYTLVQANQVPTTWNDFKAAMIKEFVPEDHVRRARDKLRKLKQTGSVSKYLSEFRNVVLTIPDITDWEKWDKFCAGLKYEIRLEVMKSTVTGFDEAAQIALRNDSAIWGAGLARGESATTGGNVDTPTPIEIGNMEKRRSGGMDPQRLRDLRNNACSTCHTVGCRPWKCIKKKGVSLANVEVDGNDLGNRNDELSEN